MLPALNILSSKISKVTNEFGLILDQCVDGRTGMVEKVWSYLTHKDIMNLLIMVSFLKPVNSIIINLSILTEVGFGNMNQSLMYFQLLSDKIHILLSQRVRLDKVLRLSEDQVQDEYLLNLLQRVRNTQCNQHS